jgi:hypothetical protein
MISLTTLLIFSFLTGSVFASDNMESDMALLEQYQMRIKKECLDDPVAAKKYSIIVNDKKVGCPELIAAAEQLRSELLKQVTFLKTCAETPESAQKDLISSTGEIIEKSAPVCEPSPDRNSCLSQMSCTALGSLPMGMSTMIKAAGHVFDSETMKTCGSQGENCLTSILRGIFDSLWSTASLAWDGAKWAGNKLGEWVGIFEKSEAKTSEAAMAAQQAGPGFIEQFKKDKWGTIKKMAENLFDSLKHSAMNHYGCEKWSGVPFASECLQPMSNWDCASCGQKTQIFCGIAGYAAGEIATSLLTGGLVAGGKTVLVGAMKTGGVAAEKIALGIGKVMPKTSAAVTKAAAKIGVMAKTGVTAAQAKAIVAWEKLAATAPAQAVAKAASTVGSKTSAAAASIAATKGGQLTGKALSNTVGAYLRAMDDAFMLGYGSVDKVGTKVLDKVFTTTTKGSQVALVTTKTFEGSKIADEALGVPKPKLVPAKNQAAASPGLIVVESRPGEVVHSAVRATPPTSSTASQTKVISYKAPSAAADEGTLVVSTSGNLMDDSIDMSASIAKYTDDQEYFKLFVQPEMYKGYRDDLATVIQTFERTQPGMSKAEIRKSIEKMMDSCDL